VWESSGTSEATQLNTLLIGEVKGRLGAASGHNRQLKPETLNYASYFWDTILDIAQG
jgi:hypothetical protein